MKVLFWSVFSVLVLALALLWLDIHCGLESVFHWAVSPAPEHDCENTCKDDLPVVTVKGVRTDLRKLFFADSNRFHGSELKKKFFSGLPRTRSFGSSEGISPYRGIPSIAYYDRFIQTAGIRHNIDPALIKAVIWRESRFDHTAFGSKGEIGLMQLLPGRKSAAADWSIHFSRALPSREELLDPAMNVDIGAWYLSRALERYRGCREAVALALCEYNAGPDRAEEWCPDSPEESVFDFISIASTKKYVEDILKQYELYRNELKLKRIFQ